MADGRRHAGRDRLVPAQLVCRHAYARTRLARQNASGCLRTTVPLGCLLAVWPRIRFQRQAPAWRSRIGQGRQIIGRQQQTGRVRLWRRQLGGRRSGRGRRREQQARKCQHRRRRRDGPGMAQPAPLGPPPLRLRYHQQFLALRPGRARLRLLQGTQIPGRTGTEKQPLPFRRPPAKSRSPSGSGGHGDRRIVALRPLEPERL